VGNGEGERERGREGEREFEEGREVGKGCLAMCITAPLEMREV